MKFLLIFFSTLSVFYNANAQIKTSQAGIKTHYSSQSAGSLILGNATEQQQQHHYAGGNSNNLEVHNYYDNRPFIPADTYPGNGNVLVRPILPTRAPVFLDATAEFINKTRAAMPSGVCYKEVPTSSLVDDPRKAAPGNGTHPNMSKIQICCEGYQRNPHVYARCDPICPDDCPNGICTAPNTCVCIPGHVRDDTEKCVTTCPIGCKNGNCDERGECQCRPGYVLEPVSRKYCMPHCEHSCQFGKCVAPNVCDCQEGFRLTASGVCEPKCDNCEFGKCTAPGYCSCMTGYNKVNGICEPVCPLGCNKGRCIKPDTCACPAGFELDRTGSNCIPHCDLPCLNGVCDGANSCLCNPGYVLDEAQRNVCKPHCPQGCPNGYCTSPNFCVCKPGFIKSGIKGRQTCVPV